MTDHIEVKTKIIIIEDEILIAEEIKSTLILLGYDVVGHAMNGDKALDLFASVDADLIILDINIRGTLTGIDLANILKDKYAVPYVFLTSYADSYTIEKVNNSMPYGYILKPFTQNDLKVNIELALHKFNANVKVISFSQDYIEQKLNITFTAREFEILTSFKEGLTYKEAANKLFISVNTVKFYQKKLFIKLDVSSKFELLQKLG